MNVLEERPVLAEKSTLVDKTRELCATIARDEDFQALLGQVEAFLNDDEARLGYQSVHERGQELNQKQQAGLQLSESEVKDFEAARERLFQNPIAMEFIEAQRSLEGLQTTINQYLGATLETGKVPTAEELAEKASGGCCGGGCGC